MAHGRPDYTQAIDLLSQSIGIYLQPEWAAKEGTDKNFQNSVINKTWAETCEYIHTVLTNKTFFLCGACGVILPAIATDYDHFLHCALEVYENVAVTRKASTGGETGVFVTFPKPIRFDAGEKCRVVLINLANLTVHMIVTAWGYEIAA